MKKMLKWVAGVVFVVFVLVPGLIAVVVGPERIHKQAEAIRAAEAKKAAEAPVRAAAKDTAQPMSNSSDSASKTSQEQDEPCEVSGPFKDNPNIKVWCAGGLYTKVNVTSDGNVIVGNFQFSKKGYAIWNLKKRTISNQFEELTNELVDQAGLHAAISLHDPSGILAGGCYRKRTERLATCK
jgi:hypothetical protein